MSQDTGAARLSLDQEKAERTGSYLHRKSSKNSDGGGGGLFGLGRGARCCPKAEGAGCHRLDGEQRGGGNRLTKTLNEKSIKRAQRQNGKVLVIVV